MTDPTSPYDPDLDTALDEEWGPAVIDHAQPLTDDEVAELKSKYGVTPLTDPRASVPTPRPPRCDHICLLDEGHVERGELHQYGYELPSPRADAAMVEQVRRERDAFRDIAIGPEPKVHEGWSTCPICGKTWWVTPSRDCLVPVCGHYGEGTDASRHDRPCDACGLVHALKCDVRPVPDVAATPTPQGQT